jgi:hypothetical protein
MSVEKRRHCSFCGKYQDEVGKLIAGPCVFICDECANLCAEIARAARAVPGEVEYASWVGASVPAAVQPAPLDPIALLRAELAESTRQIIQAVRSYGR